MHRLSKSKLYEHLVAERRLVTTIRDKLNALANAQLKQDNYTRKNEEKSSPKIKRTKPKSIDNLKNEIHLFLASVNIHPHQPEKIVPPASKEESWLIRLEWDGQFRRPADADFSAAYAREHQISGENKNQTDSTLARSYQPYDYHLEHSPSWQFMRQFESYAACRRQICEQLAVQKIPPAIVGTMNFFDFSEVLSNRSKAHRSHPFESARSRNFKMFEACYGDEFSRIMTKLHYKPEYITQTRFKMRHGYGDDLFNFHHKTNVSRFHELKSPNKINKFSNMLLTFVEPHHRVLHLGKGYDVNPELVFFGGYDPIYQIKHDPSREHLYLFGPKQKAIAHAQRFR